MNYSLPGSSVHGISQGRILEWVAFPSPGHLPKPEIKPTSPALTDGFFTTEPQGKPQDQSFIHFFPFECPVLRSFGDYLFSIELLLLLWQRSIECSCVCLFLGSFIPLICLFFPQYHTLDYCGFIIRV